jgi:hypothetical protein
MINKNKQNEKEKAMQKKQNRKAKLDRQYLTFTILKNSTTTR